MNQRQHLESQLTEDFRLLKALEDRLRVETNPRRELELKTDRDAIAQRIQERQTALEALEQQSNKRPATDRAALQRQDWSNAPDVSVFFGRTEELEVLEQWIVADRCRVVAILGIGGIGKTGLSLKLGRGGIGKTDLSLKLARGIQDRFDYVIWRKLLNAPPIEDILKDLIEFFSDYEDIDLANTLDGQLAQLLQHLKNHRCLVMLDNFETILQGGHASGQYQPGYEAYGSLLQQFGETAHQSCLLLTSREKPKEVARLEGKTKPVRSLNLAGLNAAEGQQIFNEFGEFTGSEANWHDVIQFYNGNPLALELAARHIDEVFFGDLSEFLQEGKPVFDDLRELLDWHFTRLSAPEREIAYWLTINRESTSLADLKEGLLSPTAKAKAPSTLQSLQRRLPLERNRNMFGLQPVLVEYITERLIQNICAEVETQQVQLLNQHALLKALAKEYVRESQSRSILQPIQAQLGTTLGSQAAIATQLSALLNQTRSQTSPKAGYLAGNLLNLLRQCDINIRGYDFSDLTIWQAYLQGWTLQQVNFARSDLAKSVFTQSFGTVSAVAFSPDGEQLAAGTASGDIRIWRVADGEQLLTCHGHSEWPWAIAFSPDGSLLASASQDKTIRLWDIRTGTCQQILHGHTSWVKSVAFSPDGSLLASGGNDCRVCLWEIATGQCLWPSQIHSNCHSDWVWSVAFSPDGNLLASGSSDECIKLWTLQGDCTNTLQGHEAAVKTVVFSADGQTLASGSFDRTVRLWDIETGRCQQTLQGHTELVWSVLYSPDGRILASNSDDQTTRLWDAQTGQLLRTFKERTSRVWSIAFSPDSQMLASSSGDQTVRLGDVATGQTIRTLWGYSSVMWAVAFSPDGERLASGSDQAVHSWQVSTGAYLPHPQEKACKTRTVAFSPTGTQIASGSDDGCLRLWDVETGRCTRTLPGHTNRIWSVAFNRDGDRIASSSEDSTVRLWNASTGRCLKVLTGHENRVWSVAFHPECDRIASGSDDEQVRLWDLKTDQCLQALPGHSSRIWCVAFDPTGQFLASGSADHTVRLWNGNTGESLSILEGHTNSVWSVAFSHRSHLLASAGTDRTIRVWNVQTGECLKVLKGHTDHIWSVAFSPNDETIASSSSDETIQFWSANTGNCLHLLRVDRPYEGMNIAGVTGMTEAQKSVLKSLGAIEKVGNHG